MRLTWKPENGEPREFAFELEDALPIDYEAVEDLGKWPDFEAYADAVRGGQRSAWRVALWLLLRAEARAQTPPVDLPLEAVQPKAGELAMRWNADEELHLAELALTDPDLDPMQRALIEVELPNLRAAALGKDLPATAPAPSRTRGARAGGSSRRSSTSRPATKTP